MIDPEGQAASRVVHATDMDWVLADILTSGHPEMDRDVSRAATNLKRAANILEQVEVRFVHNGTLVHNGTGLTPAAFRVLLMTWAFGPVEAKDVARLSGVSRQAVSSVLANLERAGLVTRERAVKSDKRLVPVSLTAEGRALMEENVAHHNSVQARYFASLTRQELRTLTNLLRKLIVGVAAQGLSQ